MYRLARPLVQRSFERSRELAASDGARIFATMTRSASEVADANYDEAAKLSVVLRMRRRWVLPSRYRLDMLNNLAALYADIGELEAAVRLLVEMEQIAGSEGRTGVVEMLQQRRKAIESQLVR